jgi:uncharacterized membrane protein YbhN (UPF0104 family)
VVVFALNLVGVPVTGWIDKLFDKLGELPPWAIVAGVILQTLQTTLAALAWLGILRAALPRAQISFRLVLACYAAAVSMNGFLPANIGTWVMLVMFTTLLAGATFTAMLSGLAVQKIPFSVFNIAVYLYLFLSISGSFSVKLGFLEDHQGLIVLIAIGAIVLIALLVRVFWEKLEGVRKQLLAGAAILGAPRQALLKVALPELGSYMARLAIVGVFLGAYGIPATFHNIATVTASNSISNSVSATPGGVGVTQALNTTALKGETDASTATAYSISQQLVTTAWNLVFAVIMVCWVFGWTGGRELVKSSYEDAKVRSREMKQKHRHESQPE